MNFQQSFDMKKVKQYIFKAITIEIVLAILIFSFFYTLFFSLQDTIEILGWLWYALLVGCMTAYSLGWGLGNNFPKDFKFKKLHGVLIMFAILITGIIIGMLSFSLSESNDVNNFSDFIPVSIVFLIFGGIPTFGVGVWLGNHLENLTK